MNMNMNLDLQAINDLDFREAASWPTPGKAALFVLLFLVIIGAGYWFTIRDQVDRLDSARAQETALKHKFEIKAGKAANLDKLKGQLKEMKTRFGAELRQLPSKQEVDSLLRDISQTAQVDGLQQKLFNPKAEVKKDFYAEKPIKMKLVGGYHQLGHFVSDVAALPRIVTLHGITIKPAKDNQPAKLTMTLTAKIYRYLEQTGATQH
jgi:type IV pilus assembly protein PilO